MYGRKHFVNDSISSKGIWDLKIILSLLSCIHFTIYCLRFLSISSISRMQETSRQNRHKYIKLNQIFYKKLCLQTDRLKVSQPFQELKITFFQKMFILYSGTSTKFSILINHLNHKSI